MQTEYTTETVAFYPAERNNLPYDIEIQTIRTTDPEPPAENFCITDESLGVGGAKAKFRMNMDAINLLKELEFEGRQTTSEEQEVLSKYVGWGGLADAFDDTKPNWESEFRELYAALTPEEYAAARSSPLNAHYTSPTVIRAIYEAIENMGFQTGNILEPAMGVGNFFGCLPESMQSSKLYGIELDSITGRIAKQLYPKADITVAGFETTDRKDFYDLAIGNVPFGQYKVDDRAYNKLGFSIHDYFFAKSLDQVRPGGVVAFVTLRYTMDKQSPEVRKMDLDVDVARLKLMKANHQSQQYRLEDNLLKTFPEQIKQNEGFVTGFEADLKTLAEHPHPTDGFAGMEVKGDMLTDKDNAGAAILEAFKDAKGMEPVHIGHYRGFAMSLTVEDFGKDFVLTLKGQMTHRVELGKDARGNLIRIDNVLNAMPDRMKAVQDRLANLHTQVETAKAELGKPFPQEEELRWKSARLAELNAELNIDDRTPIERMAEEPEIAKSRPSVLAKLKQAPPQESTPKRISIEKEER